MTDSCVCCSHFDMTSNVTRNSQEGWCVLYARVMNMNSYCSDYETDAGYNEFPGQIAPEELKRFRGV